MKNWKYELDGLIKETMTFVTSVQATTAASRVAVMQSSEQSTAMLVAAISPNHPDTIPGTWLSAEREEIRKRVPNFKAHQERLTREREDYANTILKGIAVQNTALPLPD